MKFCDSIGRQWEPEINVVTIGRVRDRLKINLLELVVPNSTLPDRLNDPCLMVDILYLLCLEQVEKLALSDSDFGKAMTPDGIEDGWHAVIEGIVNFSPRGLRPAYQKVMEKARKLDKAQSEKIKTLIEGPAFDAMLDKAISDRLSQLSTLPNESTGDAGNSLELSASSLGLTPSQP